MVDIIFNFNLAAKVRGYGENVNWKCKEKVQEVSEAQEAQKVQKIPDVSNFYRSWF